MAKVILIQILIIVYIIELILAKYFVFFNFDVSISNENKIISYIRTLAVFVLNI